MKINILMATYNGERFLKDQIESIQRQTVEEWELFIRDDGSTDETVKIIKEFEQNDARIKLINQKNDKNLGVIKSFHTLLQFEKADVYFFSDQDDVWLDNKIELCLKRYEKESSTQATLIYTDLKVVNQELEVISESMIKTQSDHANTELIQELTENTVTGGTMMINHALAKYWNDTDNILMHDWYLALLAAAFGKLIYLDEPTELYRQHDANVLGARTLRKRAKNWIKPHKLVEKYWWLIQSSQQQAEQLLGFPLSQENKDVITAFIDLTEKPFLQRWQLLKEYHFRKNKNFHTLVFKTLILTKLGYRRNQ